MGLLFTVGCDNWLLTEVVGAAVDEVEAVKAVEVEVVEVRVLDVLFWDLLDFVFSSM